MKLTPRITALESRTPVPLPAMDRAEALALWAAFETELANAPPDPDWINLTPRQAWERYREMLDG